MTPMNCDFVNEIEFSRLLTVGNFAGAGAMLQFFRDADMRARLADLLDEARSARSGAVTVKPLSILGETQAGGGGKAGVKRG